MESDQRPQGHLVAPGDLVGLPVRDAQGRLVGRVVHAHWSQDGLELRADLDGLRSQRDLVRRALRCCPEDRESL